KDCWMLIHFYASSDPDQRLHVCTSVVNHRESRVGSWRQAVMYILVEEPEGKRKWPTDRHTCCSSIQQIKLFLSPTSVEVYNLIFSFCVVHMYLYPNAPRCYTKELKLEKCTIALVLLHPLHSSAPCYKPEWSVVGHFHAMLAALLRN
ncbi:hypothetical protein L9F63_003754, partial [Diploptera punctata]